MKREQGNGRKVRSDKKVDVKPTMSVTLKNQLYTFCHLSEEPVKDVAERLCQKGAASPLIIEEIQKWFRRDYFLPPTIHRGYLERPRLRLILKGETSKVTIKFPQPTYDVLCTLAYALDLPPTTTATVLIKRTLFNQAFMHQYVQSDLKHLDGAAKNKINRFLHQIWGYK